MKILRYAVAAMAALIVVVIGVGYSLPQQHTARVRAIYQTPADSVYRVIEDVRSAPSWRSGVDSVRVLATDPLTWKESADWGELTMIMDEATPPTRVVTRIADEDAGFGGTWTFDVVPSATGTVLTITENGVVHNPVFRFMSRFVIGHYSGLEGYARDLGTRFQQTVQPERLTG